MLEEMMNKEDLNYLEHKKARLEDIQFRYQNTRSLQPNDPMHSLSYRLELLSMAYQIVERDVARAEGKWQE